MVQVLTGLNDRARQPATAEAPVPSFGVVVGPTRLQRGRIDPFHLVVPQLGTVIYRM